MYTVISHIPSYLTSPKIQRESCSWRENVKYRAFTEQTESASQVAAAKFLDTISRPHKTLLHKYTCQYPPDCCFCQKSVPKSADKTTNNRKPTQLDAIEEPEASSGVQLSTRKRVIKKSVRQVDWRVLSAHRWVKQRASHNRRTPQVTDHGLPSERQ